jgi:hypothetical protein
VREAAQLRAALDNGLASSASSTSCWRRPQVALPHLGEGASIIATGSTAAPMDVAKKDNPGGDPGGMAYLYSDLYSKRLIAEYGGYLIVLRLPHLKSPDC